MTTDAAPTHRKLVLSAVLMVFMLAAASGGIDVVAFLRYDVFVANQTGNLVIISLGVTQEGQKDPVLPSLVSLIAFMAAVFGTAAMRRWLTGRGWTDQKVRHRALMVEAVLLAVAAILIIIRADSHLDVRYGVIGLLAFSQGIQAVVLVRALGVAVQTVAINGPLVATLNMAAQGQRYRAMVAGAAPVGYAIGAGAGALLQIVSSGLTLVVSASFGVAAVFLGQWYHDLEAKAEAADPPAGEATGPGG